MHEEARETEERTRELAGSVEGEEDGDSRAGTRDQGRATEMMSTYLGEDADALDGFEFLTMAAAGELSHWSMFGKLNERARLAGLQELVDWVTPIQQRYFAQTLEGSLELAADEDPNEPA
jgi:hypothetical protein